MKKIKVNGRSGATSSVLPFSTGKYPVWFDDDIDHPLFVEAKDVEFFDPIKEIAENYHERSVFSSCTIFPINKTHGFSGLICSCCGNQTHTTIGIEHDSKDIEKDKSVCSDCYFKIHKYWIENVPKKIPFLKAAQTTTEKANHEKKI